MNETPRESKRERRHNRSSGSRRIDRGLPVFERHMPLPLPASTSPQQRHRLEDCKLLDWVPDSVVPDWSQDDFGRLFNAPSGELPWIFRFTRCIHADGNIGHVWLRAS